MSDGKRMRLSSDESLLIEKFRAQQKAHVGATAVADSIGANVGDLSHYWAKTEDYSLFFKTPQFDHRVFEERIIEQVKSHAPVYKKYRRHKPGKSPRTLMIVDIADLHIGKFAYSTASGDTYNEEIAVNRAMEGMNALETTIYGQNIEQVLFIGGNDILHTDDGRMTTKGTPQDTSGTWYTNIIKAQKLYTVLLDRLLRIAPVHYLHVVSNHDKYSGVSLSLIMQAQYSKNKDITFDVSPEPRKYYKYGRHLIGQTHGDGCKPTKLAQLMPEEAADEWGANQVRYFYTHHIHSKRTETYPTCIVESVYSPSASDEWHKEKGYVSRAAMELFFHQRETGLRGSWVHTF